MGAFHICHNAGDGKLSSACVLVLFSAPVSHRQRHCESPNELQTRPPRHPRVPRACNDSRVTMQGNSCPPQSIIAISSSSDKPLLERFSFFTHLWISLFQHCANQGSFALDISMRIRSSSRSFSNSSSRFFLVDHLCPAFITPDQRAHQQMLQAHPSGSSLAISACPSRQVR